MDACIYEVPKLQYRLVYHPENWHFLMENVSHAIPKREKWSSSSS